MSSSIGKESFQNEQQFLRDFVQSGINTYGTYTYARVGWVLFSSDVDISDITLTRYSMNSLVNYIDDIWYSGASPWRNTAGALQAILNEYATNGTDTRQKIVIMITNGNPCAPGKGNCPYDVCEYGPTLKAAS